MKQELERIGYLGAIESSFRTIPVAASIILGLVDVQS